MARDESGASTAAGPILVVGATGTVGREVVRQLAARGASVRAFVRDEQRGRAILGGFEPEYAVGDLGEPASVARAARGCGALFLLTQDGPRQVEHAVGAARAAADAGAGHIAVLSSSSSAPDSPFSWSRDHHAIERHVETLGIAYSHLRPHYFMQNLFDVLHIEADGVVLRMPMGSGRLSAIDVRDVAACAAAVLTGTPLGRAAVLTGGASFSLPEAAATLSAHTGITVRYDDEDPASHLAATLAAGVERDEADSIALMYKGGRAGNLDLVTAEVQSITGCPPRTLATFAAERAAPFLRRAKRAATPAP
jgi:uncharacterized protein YbjT (DUF2867 family)